MELLTLQVASASEEGSVCLFEMQRSQPEGDMSPTLPRWSLKRSAKIWPQVSEGSLVQSVVVGRGDPRFPLDELTLPGGECSQGGGFEPAYQAPGADCMASIRASMRVPIAEPDALWPFGGSARAPHAVDLSEDGCAFTGRTATVHWLSVASA